MDVSDLNKNNILLGQSSKENKKVFLLVDFNINLLNYNDHQPTNEFVDYLASNSFIPYTLRPTGMTSHSKSLIDSVFSNKISHDVISDNIIATISDHLHHFLLAPNVLSNNPKNPIFKKEIGQNLFNQTLYLSILIKIGLMFSKLDQQDVNLSIESFLDNTNSALDEHIPLKRINKYKLKFKSKSWITPAIQKSVIVKNSLLKINGENSQTKETFYKQYKDYRNMLSTLF